MDSFAQGWRVDLQLAPSRFLLCLIPALHVLAALAVLRANLPLFLQGVLLTAILLLGVFSWHKEYRRALVLREQAQDWWLESETRQGRVVLQRSQVWRYLVVMDFCGQDEKGSWRQRVVILPDALAPDSFRRLRVRLRHGALPAANS